MERALPSGRMRDPSPGWGTFLHDLWCESWTAAMSLSCAVRDRAARRVRLDGDQFETLACVIENDVVLVYGGAGRYTDVFNRESQFIARIPLTTNPKIRKKGKAIRDRA